MKKLQIMNHNLRVDTSVVINANTVWEALTNPEKIKEYLYGTQTITDWKVGSDVIFQGEYQGHKYKDHEVILENKPCAILSYSYWTGFSGLEDQPENYSKIIYTLKPLNEKTTEFTWTQIGFANEIGYNHSKNGMSDFLNKLKEVAEK